MKHLKQEKFMMKWVSILLLCIQSAVAAVDVASLEDQVTIENNWLSLSFNLTEGTYSIYNKEGGYMAVKDASNVFQPGETVMFDMPKFRFPKLVYKWQIESVQDEFGAGKRLVLVGATDLGYFPDRVLHFTVYEKRPHIIIGWGVHNRLKLPIRIQEVWPMYGGQLFTEQKSENIQILQSGSGARHNFVNKKLDEEVENGLMATWSVNGQRFSLVAGGARYEDFIRYVSLGTDYSLSIVKGKNAVESHNYEGEKLGLKVYDPVGKRIEPGDTYMSPDTFYLDVVTRDPFVTYEQYGDALQIVNKAEPNFYNFPTLCGWTASRSHYGMGVEINNAVALVNEMDQAKQKNFHRYFTPGIRLEPDTYQSKFYGDTEQGWWTDESLMKCGHLVKPYDSWEAYGDAIHQRGGIPITYCQASIPSVDFSQKFPGYLINNDNSLAYTPYWHPLPPVRYDYTDPGFQQHFYAAWKKIGDAGIKGVKVDYPATAWIEGGGFEDKTYTATQAYRKQFELLRKGLGPDAVIHERVLGRRAPATDASAGLVDLQRVWGDSSHLEPTMVTKIGLRWYKNRKVYSYYEDGKNFYVPVFKTDGEWVLESETHHRSFLSCSGFLSGKLDLTTSYTAMTEELARKLGRIYPVITERKSPRPADMLLNRHPTTYVYDVTDDWVQVMLFNPDEEDIQEISAPISGDMAETGSLGLKANAGYHVYDFWNQEYLGILKGTESLARSLEPVSALIYSVRKVLKHPQVISTNRHFMQGMVELSNVKWDPVQRVLSGTSSTIEGETTIISLAENGYSFADVSADSGAKISINSVGEGVIEVSIFSEKASDVSFEVKFK